MRHPQLHSFALTVKELSVCLLVTLAFAVAATAQTQSTTGTIQGTVLDANGAAIPGASVEIKNSETNFTRTLTTDEDGRFVALSLPSGRYTVTVVKQGFATQVLEQANLTVGQALNLPLSMKISGVEERVTVIAPTVDTIKTESSTTLNQDTVNNTPILGRKFEDLLTLTPGVSVVQGPDGDEITFAGQRGVFNNVTLDGGDYNNGFFGEQLGGQRAAIDIPLDAVKEFQVVATGASAEFGRTAGGVINVISKSGTNETHGSLFYFQRLEALTAHTSDGKPLKDFRREQLGGAVGGPIRRDKAFFFFSFEGIRERLTRANLSEQIGTAPCPVAAPVITNPAHEILINSNPDCQRLSLINFISATRGGLNEGTPVPHPIRNYALLGKLDFNLNRANQLGISYNADYSKNTNQTFDVATYGASANGIEGLSKINNLNFNLISTISATKVNEAHFSYSRENRPRKSTPSNVPADTAMGFATTFRFGSPFFLQPTIDELLWRTHVKDNFSIVSGNHTVKVGGEWIHTLNDQVFRGFFTGRYIFDSVTGFLRYASPAAAGGFGPRTIACSNGTFVTSPTPCPVGTTATGGPLLLFLQNGSPTGIAGLPAPGASKIKNEDQALFVQDKWQAKSNLTLSLGLRWEAQIFPKPILAPSKTAYGPLLSNPRFPSDGTLHSPKKEFQPRAGFAWDIGGKGESVLRGSYGIYYGRQNMLTQVGSITDNGAQQFGLFCNSSFAFTCFGASTGPPTWPGILPTTPTGTIPFGASVRVFSKDYANPRIYTTNFGFEQEVASGVSAYFDFTHAKGVHLTRFFNYARTGFFPTLGDVFVTSANGKSLYRGFTAGIRKRLSKGYQFEANYVLSKDLDDDSNERDPFTDRSFNIFNQGLDYALSDRDIRHKFNFFMGAELPAGLKGNFRVQARGAQPISPAVRTATNRNSLRKDNKYFSFDWRLERPFKFGEHMALTPVFELFNTFNNANNINPLSTPGLFNFDGFLRQGVGDPRQAQLALKFEF